MTFTVALDLSPRAIARIARLHDRAVLTASVFGMSSAAGATHSTHNGQVSLGYEKVTIPAKVGTTKITVRGITAEMMTWIMDGSLKVRISGEIDRPTGPDWSMRCVVHEGPVPVPEPVHIAYVLDDER